MSQLVIVESPTKAKTIKKFLGKDYNVQASMGHIRDLPSSGLAVDVDGDFEPEYEIPDEKKGTVTALRKAMKEADGLWIATDEDREGEAIGWHLIQALKPKKEQKVQRIVFHEITKGAIDEAVANPREIDKKLVEAQQARRILDRLVGYTLSPFLWKKVYRGLSAGRVQSSQGHHLIIRVSRQPNLRHATLIKGFVQHVITKSLTHSIIFSSFGLYTTLRLIIPCLHEETRNLQRDRRESSFSVAATAHGREAF